MADELNIPTHRWYQPRNNISLPNSDFSKQWIYDSGIQKIDRWINSQPWGNPINALFALAEPGVWFDPSDLTTLFQDPAGTTPVTAPGNTVGLMLDKSKGLALGAELVNDGTFSGGTVPTGWVSAAGSASVSGGQFNVVASGGAYTGMEYSVAASTQAGRSYIFEATLVSGTGRITVQEGVAGDTPNIDYTGPQTFRFVVQRGVTGNFRLLLRTSASGGTTVWDNISVRELAGNHATQATLAARPTYSIEPVGGRRNLLTFSEQFDNAAWVKYRSAVTVNAATAPSSTMTATKLVPAAGLSPGFIYYNAAIPLPVGTVTTTSVYVKAAELGFAFIANNNNASSVASGVCINLTTGALTNQGGSGTYSAVSVGNGWWRVSVTSTTTTTTINSPEVSPLAAAGSYATYTGDGVSGIYIWGAQQEVGSTATAYQRVTTQHDVTEPGVASVGYLYFDGASDAMATGNITTGTEKAQVFAGLRKLANPTEDVLVGFGSNPLTNNGFELQASHYFSSPKGIGVFSLGPGYAGAHVNDIQAPISLVFTSTIARKQATAAETFGTRINGVTQTQIFNGTTSLPTGDFATLPLYIGARAGTSLPFTGHLYSLITRFGPTLDAPTITSTEIWVGDKTGIDVAKNISTTIYTRSGDTILDRANSTIERRAV